MGFEYLVSMARAVMKGLIKIYIGRNTHIKKQKDFVIGYLDDCLKKFTEVQSPDEKIASAAHAWLKSAYDKITPTIGKYINAKDCDIIRHSILSGRIYYQAKRFEKLDEDELALQYSNRRNIIIGSLYDRDDFRHNSYERVLNALVHFKEEIVDENERIRVLQQIKEVCEEDFARISAIRNKIKSETMLIFVENI